MKLWTTNPIGLDLVCFLMFLSRLPTSQMEFLVGCHKDRQQILLRCRCSDEHWIRFPVQLSLDPYQRATKSPMNQKDLFI